MPTLAITNFNIVCATLGGFITVFGLVSYLLKEKFYLSEALISLVAGLIFSPHASNLVRPDEYALHQVETLDTITLYFTRLVLGVQLVLAGVQLPSKYLKTEWKSLALLLGPGMTVMWIVTSLLVFAMVPHINFLQALAVGACVTPTDPVLSNSIVKGKFADENIPKELQKIVIAESGANDGLGYPFLFLPLYLIMHVGHGGLGSDDSVKNAIGLWFGETWGYTIVLSVVYGATVGWIAKELLHWAEERKYVDRESFLVFAITLALFIVGTVGMVGSDDVLACFIAGNTFTWDDWFRLETMDDSFQPTIDMLLNVTIFIWFGAVCPWSEFYHNNVIPIYRLIFLGILVLLLRRPPIIYAMHKWIPQIEQKRQALFVGFFGPIGVSAIFYLYVSLEFLRKIEVDGEVREDAKYLMEVMNVVIWFLCICSIVVHGLSIPMAKLGFIIPRTLSNVLSTQRSADGEPEAFYVPNDAQETEARVRRRTGGLRSGDTLPQRVVRIGRSIIPSGHGSSSTSRTTSQAPTPAPLSTVGSTAKGDEEPKKRRAANSNAQGGPEVQRTIRFPDEEPHVASRS
ncbi:Sodium/hydrogen exchanger family-domain-containing protein [Ampelomyces quisqualis]|uniref:Sodium/hydrogen exchanger family-domain-containing protein n=1 Tax=Ampelomyces quisqualis TaxID=50730 RepID=A0A6A5QSZ1_AMPQU|nr:Sodium/hydrogen exchanger family-domain-containing protein [Ampelomyces quisqualis]